MFLLLLQPLLLWQVHGWRSKLSYEVAVHIADTMPTVDLQFERLQLELPRPKF